MVPGPGIVWLARVGGKCAEFTSASSMLGATVTIVDRGLYARTPGNGFCDDQNHVICAERGHSVDVAPVIETGRIAFVSDTGFVPNAGLVAADALCNADAAAAQLPGTYRAWLGTSGGGAETRFVPAGEPWRRIDGPRLAPTAADFLAPTSPPYLTSGAGGGRAARARRDRERSCRPAEPPHHSSRRSWAADHRPPAAHRPRRRTRRADP